MGKRKKEGKHGPSMFDRARNELFSQIRHCGVLQATVEQQVSWFNDTMDYIAKRYPGVTEEELDLLKEQGLRYCQPVTPYGGSPAELAEGKA